MSDESKKSKSQQRREAVMAEAKVDENRKDESQRPFMFPEHSITIVASSREEAEEKLKSELDKRKQEEADNEYNHRPTN